MTRRVTILGVIFTGILTLGGCLLVVGGLWFAFRTIAPTGTSTSSSGDPGSTLTAPSSGRLPRIGGPAPDFTLTGLDKQTVQLSQLHGKAVLLNFWATWCGPCSAEMPNIQQVYASLSPTDVAILAVNQGEFADQVQGYSDLYHLHFPILLDDHGRVGNLYGVQALPTSVFVDPEGIIREIHIGGPMTQEFIRSHIASLLKQ